jgi:lysyl-tRNA synthetase class 2
MKRLLAAGSGDIYFLGHVFRGAERGRLHNPEFTLIEWYRRGFTLAQLMQEVAQLIERLCRRRFEAEHITYRAAFEREVGFDPLAAPDEVLRDAAARLGLPEAALATCTRDELLDLIMGAAVGPRLGRGRLTFVQGYPASQAALARLDPRDARVALRFELYSEGMELANGFDELADAAEQRARFEADQRERQRRGLPIGPLDERLLAALAAGLPPCAGVAVGFDRVLMLAEGAEHIDAVLPFTLECA